MDKKMLNIKGFALIEVGVVLVLLSMLSILVIVQWSCFARSMVRSQMDMLAAHCMHAQRCAQLANEPIQVTFDLAHQAYTVQGYHHALGGNVRFGVVPGVQGPPSTPTKPIGNPVTFPQCRITFWPSGIMQAGTVYLVDATHQYQYALSCAVSTFSYLRKYRYDRGWQVII